MAFLHRWLQGASISRQSTGVGVWERVEIVGVAEVQAGKVLLDDENQRAAKAQIDGGVNPHLIASCPCRCLLARQDDNNFAARVSNLRRHDRRVAHESVRQRHLVTRREVDRLLDAACANDARYLRLRDPESERVALDPKLRNAPLACCCGNA
jgi:hypothetical protein